MCDSTVMDRFRIVGGFFFFLLDDLLLLTEKLHVTPGQLAFLDEAVILQESQGAKAGELLTRHTAL